MIDFRNNVRTTRIFPPKDCDASTNTGGLRCSYCDSVILEKAYTKEGTNLGSRCVACGEINRFTDSLT